MYCKPLSILVVAVYSSICFGDVEVSVTDKLAKSEISFYSQSGSGVLKTCGVEFNGMDSNLNYFSGSFALLYLGEQNIVPILKLNSLSIKSDGSAEQKQLKSVWLKSPTRSTLSNSWVSQDRGSEIVVVSRNLEDVMLYVDITTGKQIKIGYLQKGSEIDSVYQLEVFPVSDAKQAGDCYRQLLSQAIPK